MIATGGIVINAANALREAGANVLGVAAIFSYELEKGKQRLREAQLNVHTLTNFDTLLDVAVNAGHISGQEQEMIQKWRAEPDSVEWLKH